MKKQLYSRKIGIAALIAASIFIFVLLHFCRMSTDKIPELEFSGYVNQSDFVNNCNLDHVKFPPETACAVYKLKKVDSAQDQKNIRKALGLDENAKFGTLSDPMPVSSTSVLGYDTKSGRWIYQTDLAYDTGENVPEEQKAIQIANDFISNLYPVETLGNPTAIADMSGEERNKPSSVVRWNVFYYPTVENRPIYGVFRICIAVGAEGKIVGVEKLAGEYEKIAQVQLSDLRTIKNRFLAQDFLCTRDESPQNRKMEQAELGFYADVGDEYIQPVYVVSSDDGMTEILIDAQNRGESNENAVSRSR